MNADPNPHACFMCGRFSPPQAANEPAVDGLQQHLAARKGLQFGYEGLLGM